MRKRVSASGSAVATTAGDAFLQHGQHASLSQLIEVLANLRVCFVRASAEYVVDNNTAPKRNTFMVFITVSPRSHWRSIRARNAPRYRRSERARSRAHRPVLAI